MEFHATEAKTIEELYRTLTSLIHDGSINDIVNRIVEANPGIIDPRFEMIEGTPQAVYQAEVGKIIVLTIGEFLALVFNRPDFSNLPTKGGD